ncbi:MAG: beta-lactamase family protein [Rhodobacteraceae bacterium]|nr:beta-lactamase family protein [Paracoccaceae bacterium]
MTDQAFDMTRMERIKDWMQSYVEEGKFPGSTVLVTQAGNEVFYHETGLRNIDAGLPFTRDTVARIFSMTKPVTSVAIMMLAERGLFHLDAPVSRFLPEFAEMQALVPGAERLDQCAPCATPTLHQLLTHTSGLSYGFNPGPLGAAMTEGKLGFAPRAGTLDAMVRKVAELPLAFAPGSSWEYSVAIDVLGRVVEVVSGKSLDAFFRDEIFGPLEMSQTGFSVAPGTGDRLAALYTSLPGDGLSLEKATGDPIMRQTDAPGKSPWEAATLFSGGGGLVGTIDDYHSFCDMLRRGGTSRAGAKLLSPATCRFMMRNHLPGDIASMGPDSFAEQPMEGMGFGLGGAVVLDPARARVPGHVGDFSWGGIASTFFWIDPVADVTALFFTQLTPSSAYPGRSEMKALIHGALTR